MIPYIILVGAPALVAILSKKYKIKNRTGNSTAPITVFFVLLIALLSLRGMYIGNDTSTYMRYFDKAEFSSWSSLFADDKEYGYLLLEKISSKLLPNFQWFLFLISLIAIIPIWRFYKKYSENAFLSVALFVAVAPFSMYFSGLRQIIAMAFSYPAYILAKKRKLKYFIAIVLLAFMFHRSAFILLIMYPAIRFKITKKSLLWALPSILAVFVFNKPIFNFILVLIGDFYSAKITETNAYTVLLLLVIFTVYAFVIPDDAQLDDDTFFLRNLLLLSLCLQCFAPIHPLAMRMNYYFLLFIPVLITKLASHPKEGYKNVASFSVAVMMVVFVGYFFVNTASGGGLNIYPYVPFWR